MRFFRLFDALGKLGTGIIALLIGFFSFNQYFFTEGEELERLETLYAANSLASVKIDSSYREVDVTIKGIDVEYYEVSYSFEVNGQEYEDKYSFDDEEDIFSQEYQVHYLPDDPSINQLNLAPELAEAREDNNSTIGLYIGIGALLFGALMIYLGQKKFRENMRRKRREEEEEGNIGMR